MNSFVSPHLDGRQLAVVLGLAVAASSVWADELETPQVKVVSRVHATTCMAEKENGKLPESFWTQIDQTPLFGEFGKVWDQLKKTVYLNGYAGAKCWVEEQRGDLIVGGTLSEKWGSQRPKFALYRTKTLGSKTVVTPGVVTQVKGMTPPKRWISASQFDLESRTMPPHKAGPSYEEFSTFNYCSAREKAGFAAFQPNLTERSKAVAAYMDVWGRLGDGYVGSPQFKQQFNVADPIQELSKVMPNWGALEPDFGRPVKGWPMKAVAEAGELVLALQSDLEGTPGRYWVFRVLSSGAQLQIVPAFNVVERWLQIYPHVASFQSNDSRDLGKTELALLDAYCQASPKQPSN